MKVVQVLCLVTVFGGGVLAMQKRESIGHIRGLIGQIQNLMPPEPCAWNDPCGRALLAKLNELVVAVGPVLPDHAARLSFALALAYWSGGSEGKKQARELFTKLPATPALFDDFCELGLILRGNTQEPAEAQRQVLQALTTLRVGGYDSLLDSLDRR